MLRRKISSRSPRPVLMPDRLNVDVLLTAVGAAKPAGEIGKTIQRTLVRFKVVGVPQKTSNLLFAFVLIQD